MVDQSMEARGNEKNKATKYCVQTRDTIFTMIVRRYGDPHDDLKYAMRSSTEDEY